MAEMINATLSESADLRVLDAQRVVRTMRDLQLAGGRYEGRVNCRKGRRKRIDHRYTLLTGAPRAVGTE